MIGSSTQERIVGLVEETEESKVSAHWSTSMGGIDGVGDDGDDSNVDHRTWRWRRGSPDIKALVSHVKPSVVDGWLGAVQYST